MNQSELFEKLHNIVQKEENFLEYNRIHHGIKYHTVLIVVKNPKNNSVLLGKHMRGIGEGKWNFPGGKLEKWETLAQAAVRETEEETGIILQEKNLKKIGYLRFYFPESDTPDHDTTIFVTEKFSAEIKKTSEFVAEFIWEKNIPYEKMWSGDELWIPEILAEKNIEYDLTYDKNFQRTKHEKIL